MESESCSLNTTIHKPGRQAFNTITTHAIVACNSSQAQNTQQPPPRKAFLSVPPLSFTVLMTRHNLPHIHPLRAKIIPLELTTGTVIKLELGARTLTWICTNPKNTVSGSSFSTAERKNTPSCERNAGREFLSLQSPHRVKHYFQSADWFKRRQ